MNRLYANVIRYFLVMLSLLLISGVWMFIEHSSLNIITMSHYYGQKTLFGLLETLTPHLFGMGTVVFILSHFLALQNKNSKIEAQLSLGLFILMILSNFTVFFIEETSFSIALIKLVSTFLLLLTFFIIIIKVYFRTKL